MTYVFKCPECGDIGEYSRRDPAPRCFGDTLDDHDVEMVRDYRAESVGIQTFTSALGDGKVETKVVNP